MGGGTEEVFVSLGGGCRTDNAVYGADFRTAENAFVE